MLSLENLKEFTKKFQTVEKNVVREYVQHLFLASLYKLQAAEKLLFKGGTALRFIYESPRFSEDLDFTGKVYRYKTIEELFLRTLLEIEKQGIKMSLKEAKPTTGGYLGIIHYELYGFVEDMKFEISLRKGNKLNKEITTIISDFVPPYTVCHLSGKDIVKEKVRALISRKKSRDYYDLYFILRHPTLRKYLPKEALAKIKESLIKKEINFKKELEVLLPVSHHPILKKFKSNLFQEIDKFL